MSAPAPVPGDRASGRARETAAGPRHPNLVLATTILASSLAFVDGSVVNVGLPAIGRSLGADASALQWVVNAYLLPLSALLLLGGAAGDRYGQRRLLISGIGLFALASLLCAAASDLATMLGGRCLQGIGAAMLMPASLAILGTTFAGEQKGRAVGIWAAAGAIAGAAGPVLGGWLIDLGAWRAIFLINLPLAAAAILLAWRAIPADRENSTAALDWRGGTLATASLGLITWALTAGAGHAGWTPVALLAAAGGTALFIGFVFAERPRGDRAMMPLALFASGSYVGLTLLTLALYGALGALLVLVPFALITAGAYSGTAAGAALLPFPLVIAFASPWAGRLAGRMGARLPLTVGSLIVAAGFVLALRAGPAFDYWYGVFPGIFVIALGMSLAVAPLTTAVLESVGRSHTGAAAGFNSAVARTGSLVATALLGKVLDARGPALVSGFGVAMTISAIASVAAAASAYFLVAPASRKSGGATAADPKDR